MEIKPPNWLWTVAVKKVAYMIAKVGVGYLTAKAVTSGQLTLDQVAQMQITTTASVTAVLEAAHDWARMKWPDAKWL
jgi:hypothetical protein